jgi:hypothetical protein
MRVKCICLGFVRRGLPCCILWISAVLSAQADKVIRLQNELIATPTPARTMPRIVPQAAETTVSGLFIIQFTDRPRPAWREQLRQAGVDLLRYLPDDAFVARSHNVTLDRIRTLPFVHWVGAYRPELKMHRSLRQAAAHTKPGTPLQVSLLISPRATPAELAEIQNRLQHVQRDFTTRFGRVTQGLVNETQLVALAESPAVLWIEPAPKPKLLDEVATKIVAGGTLEGESTDHLTDMQRLGFDGRDVVVAVADSGLDTGDAATMHRDLQGRVDDFMFYGNLIDASDEHGHGTHVAGIIAGDGATGEVDDGGAGGFGFGFDLDFDSWNEIGTPTRAPALYGLGVAPRAHIVVQRIFDADGGYEAPPSNETLTHDAVRAGAIIGSNSWGDEVQGRYDLNAAEFDALVRDADAEIEGDQPYILEFSAGNAGPGAQTIYSPAVAKNVIATGAAQNDRPEFFLYADGPDAMADFSSRGPCQDGRIKPDLVAPGTWIASLRSVLGNDDNAWAPISENYLYQGGTSQAGPHVSGAAAVFVQFYRQTHTNATPSPALVKAALINSAADMDDSAGTRPAPNMDEGWGRVDLTQLIGAPRRYEFIDQTVLLTTDQTYEHSIVVASTNEPLKITLAYTDVPGFPAAIPALVNDLDLEVIAPSGEAYHGNRFNTAGKSIPDADTFDSLNNVEAVHLRVPRPGEYHVRIRARNVVEDARMDTPAVDQDFALVVSGDLPLPGVGVIVLDRAAYRAPSFIQITLIDPDLAGQNSASVLAKSSTEPAGERIALQPFGSAGVFTGLVATASGPPLPNSHLEIAHGDLIEVSYQDAAAARIATAMADLQPPELTSVLITNQFGKTIISWNTDEPANSVVRYGTDLVLSLSTTNRALTTNHEVALDDLVPGSRYYVLVTSTDEAGNARTNDNSGQLFTFIAAPPHTVLLVNAYTPIDPFFSMFAQDIPLSSYTDALDQTGFSYDIWETSERGSPSANDLRPFRVVIWRLNDNPLVSLAAAPDTLSLEEQSAVRTYVNGGGSFFISSMELLTRLGNVPFRLDVLHVLAFEEDAMVPSVVGIEGDPVSRGLSLDLDYSAYNSDILELLGQDPDLADTITVATNAAPIFLETTSGRAAGLRFPKTGQDSPGRVVFLPFPLDAVPEPDTPPNNRAGLLRKILAFLAPGANGLGTIAFDRPAYTLPDRVTIELADSDLVGLYEASIRVFSDSFTNGLPLRLQKTSRPGLFRGSITLAPSTNPPADGELRAGAKDRLWAEYFDASANETVRTEAAVDVVPAVISNVDVAPEYEEATVSWETSKPTDALVQFGESVFLSRTAYASEFSETHDLALLGLQPDRIYYYQVVSRDIAGNVTVDDNQGRLRMFRTLKPVSPPWFDNVDTNSETNWSVLTTAESYTQWQLGPPNNGKETNAYSPPNAWASNINGDPIDVADTLLITPALSLAGGNLATLRFWHSYDFSEQGEFDIYHFGQVYISTNNSASWTQLDEFSDSSSGWEEAEIDLTPYLGRVVRIGFYYGLLSFDAVPRPGWLLDDILVTVTNFIPGTIEITNNLAQASFTLDGPVTRVGRGLSLILTNAPQGEYVLTFNDVPYFLTPTPQTNVLLPSQRLLFQGFYSFPDVNSNAISDLWELQLFGTVSPDRTPTTDTDQDGFSDFAEFMAGTNPTNPGSLLLLSGPSLTSSGALQFTWPSVPGHAYRLGKSTNTLTWTPIMDWVRATSTNSHQNVVARTNEQIQLFRLEVRP